MQAPKPAPPDPAVQQQQAQATANDTQAIKNSLGQDTQNLWSLFGNGQQLSYVKLADTSVKSAAPQKDAVDAPVNQNYWTNPNPNPGGNNFGNNPASAPTGSPMQLSGARP